MTGVKKDYTSTIMRMAGNIAPALIHKYTYWDDENITYIARKAVRVARAIVQEVLVTEPFGDSHD